MRYMRRRLGPVLTVALVALALSAPAAFADPVNNPHAEVLTIDCEGEPVEVVVTSGAPGHVVGSTSVGIPKSGTFSMYVNGELVEQESFSQGKGVKDLTTCSFSEEFVDPESGDTIRFDAEFQVLITPRGPGA